MRFFKWMLTTVGTMLLGMAGGQGKLGGKAPRRFGIPILSAIAGVLHDGFDWRDLAFLLFIPLLITGYGENSFLMSILGSDLLVRAVYGLLLAVPFFFFGWRRGAFAAVLLPLAFLIPAGSLGNVSWFGDILIADMIRYGTLGALIAYTIFVPRRDI